MQTKNIEPRVRIVIGRHIEKLRAAEAGSSALFFPELGPADGTGQRWPQHSQDTVNAARIAMTNAADLSAPPLTIVTHAQAVVAVAGELVEKKVLLPSEVVVLMKGEEEGQDPSDCPVQQFGFSDDGVLTGKWPYGWFEWA